MPILSVKDLTEYLSREKMSPETLAKQTSISNMTIRRLLKKEPDYSIPAKYLVQLNAMEKDTSVALTLRTLSESGASVQDVELFLKQMDSKFETSKEPISSQLRSLRRRIREGLGEPELRLALGALKHFLENGERSAGILSLVIGVLSLPRD